MSDHRRTPMQRTPMPLVNELEGGYLIEDDFEHVYEDIIGQKGSQGTPIKSPFSSLAKGKTLGKRGVVNVISAAGVKASNSTIINLFELYGDDEDAMQIGVTLGVPGVLPTAGLTLPDNPQDISQSQDNEEIAAVAFSFGRPEATIEWGIGGVSNKAVVDFGNGLMVNLLASFVRIHATVVAEGTLTAAAYTLNAFVGPAHAAPSVARKTVFLGLIGAANVSAVFPVPRFARYAQVMAANGLATDDYQIEWSRASAGGADAVHRWLGAAGSSPYFLRQDSKVEIPGSAYYFRVRNNGAADQNRMSVVFDLAI